MMPGFTAEVAVGSARRGYVTARRTSAGEQAAVYPQAMVRQRVGGGLDGGLGAGLGGELAAITQCVCPCCIQVAGRLFCCD
jgi:hypothetical protein